MSTVLILGDERDPHVAAVRDAVLSRGSAVFVFNFRDFYARVTLTAENHVSAHFANATGDLNSDEVSAVWWRIKPSIPNTPPPSPVATNFKNREWEYLLRSLPGYMPSHVKWLNPIEKQVFLNYKPNQMPIALKAGLKIPPTLFTNENERILARFQRDQTIVYKTLSPFVDPPDGVIMTNFVGRGVIAANNRQIAVCPGTFQAAIEKEFELRVYVVGEKIFAFRIESQRSIAGKMDWRRAQSEEIFDLVELDGDTVSKLKQFQLYAGIVYGAYDLIVSTDGSTYFLECNPAGQWLWLEHALGTRIADTVAELLAG
ncbi:hypothetical protein IQ16_02656 [Bradyrhizobium huanghuaihaiense]|uniref:ATP-grasp domain-containing protein n=1 Tax=Bradyrhizobium huanghuaihaiense TaxID=990078 RepID=A0A562RSF6_9BRAD|nr:hypothetical protein [Bradyrhizobium huanghuaihaiense]TWI71982.1 hypothetical protein IQ16_02656 [Bradyrhizobium huanghuaihaiense]